MRQFSTTVVASAGGFTYSPAYVVDTWSTPCNIAVGVKTVGAGSALYTVQHTFEDPFSVALNSSPTAATWRNNSVLVSASVGDDTNYAFAPTAIRLALAGAVSAQATMTIVQSGPR